MRQVKTKTGGVVNVQEKGDPAPPGAGRPQGSVSFKTIANKILDGIITREDAEGKKLKMTRREAMVFGIIEDAINEDDPTVRLRAGLGIWDRIEPKDPIDINLNNINNGGDATPEQVAALKTLLGKNGD